MILHDLFEGRMKDIDIEYQDFLRSRGRNAMTDRQFQDAYGMTRTEWAKKNREWTQQKERRPVAPDAHLFHEENQQDRNARIIAGEIEDAVSQNNLALAEQKIKELNDLGYYIDARGEIRPYGMYEGQVDENLRKWFKEKWVRFGPDGKIRGDCARGSDSEGKPKCLPQSKAHALGKKGRASAAAKKRREDPNPERRGAAKNVATKVKEQRVAETIPAKSVIRGYTVFYNPSTRVISVTVRGTDEQAAIEQAKLSAPNLKNYRLAVDRLIDRIESSEKLEEKQDACYHKVKSRYKVWPSAYASGALVQCRKKGAANWGKGSKK